LVEKPTMKKNHRPRRAECGYWPIWCDRKGLFRSAGAGDLVVLLFYQYLAPLEPDCSIQIQRFPPPEPEMWIIGTPAGLPFIKKRKSNPV